MWLFTPSSPEIQFRSKLLIGIYPTGLHRSLSAQQLRVILSSISSRSCPRIPCKQPCRPRTPQCSSLCYRDQPGLLETTPPKSKHFRKFPLKSDMGNNFLLTLSSCSQFSSSAFFLYSPTRSDFSVSQMLTLKSSYPASNKRPERDGAREVTPHMMVESW